MTQIHYKRNKPNIAIANIMGKMLKSGSGRLSKPLKNKEISILNIFDAIKSQSCIRVKNYEPDKANKHLEMISLGPSYLEQQISITIDKAIENHLLPKSYDNYIRKEIGLNPKETIKEDIDIKNLKNSKILIEIPKLRQSEEYSCGATVIQMILSYYGLDIKESKLIDELDVKHGSGVKLSKIQNLMDKFGFKTDKKLINFNQLKSLINRKIPQIIAIEKIKGKHHFVIPVGYYDDGIIFADPSKYTNSYLTNDEFSKKIFKSIDEILTLQIFTSKKPEYDPDIIEKL